ncbi:hypothetical protein ABEB36_012008 [Hypothenemus hampei]|uniref:Uncharacterized protein n=1 Tax=Hypothenemus hampei TaxID=57062 RepID=A0ABD1E9V5_HYPHA
MFLVQVAVILLVTVSVSLNLKNIPSIHVCFNLKHSRPKICQNFSSFPALQEFMTTPHVKVEILNQPFGELGKNSFSHIAYTKELTFRNCSIKLIEPFAFNGSLSLLKVDLQNNELEILKNGIFNDLLIVHLNLGYNRLHTIEPDALSYMQNLEEILLMNNDISVYESDWFHHTPLLKSLNFENNTIRKLPGGVFKNLIDKPFGLDLFFCFNAIIYVDSKALFLQDLTISKLYLDHNHLEKWEESLSVNVELLNISFNQLRCIEGDLRVTIKNTSLNGFKENPYECDCLKEIKSIGDRNRDYSEWFMEKYLHCRKLKKNKTGKFSISN